MVDDVDDGWWSLEQLMWEEFQLREDIEEEIDEMYKKRT